MIARVFFLLLPLLLLLSAVAPGSGGFPSFSSSLSFLKSIESIRDRTQQELVAVVVAIKAGGNRDQDVFWHYTGLVRNTMTGLPFASVSGN